MTRSAARLAPALLLLGSAGPALADDFQQWLTATVRADLSDRISIQEELITRFSDNRGGLNQIENSVLLGYKIDKATTVWAGYVHNPRYNGGKFRSMERRAREQVTVDNFAKLGDVSVSGRLRLEQRWRDDEDGTAWRVRPYVKLSLPLGGKSDPVLNLTEEAFFNLNNTPFEDKDGLERTRTAASITVPVSKVVRFETGYLNQHRFVTEGPDIDEHVLTAAISLAF